MHPPETTSLLDQIVHEASGMPPEDRARFLQRRCGADDELLAEARDLLDLDSELLAALDRPLFDLHAPTVSADEVDASPSTGIADRLGPYTVEQELGRGGLSTVYLARRSDGGDPRPVALKVLKTGLHTDELERRFTREGEILAGLRHPGIAQIFGGGTSEDGRPYLVMEWIQGRPLDRYVREEKPPLKRRLELFIALCESVAYAHGRLVVHRDIKPGNILVDDSGRPRLLDFGISKLLDPATAHPVTQTQGFGPMTPEYAAPEQVRRRPVSIATDIYALGIVLHEMLTGERPYRAGLQDPDWWKIVCDQEPEAASRTAARVGDGISPGRLRGDLDAVILRCLRKEPEQRYSNVERLIDDLKRYLDRRPVRARRGTWLYRGRKFVVRHRLALGFVAVLAMVVTSFTVDRERQRHRLIEERDRATAVGDLLLDIFRNASPGAPVRSEITLGEVVDLGARRLDHLDATPSVQMELMGTIGDIYTTLGSLEQATPLLQDSLTMAEQLYGDDETSPALARSHTRSGLLARADERFEDAERHFEAALRVVGNDVALQAKALGQLGLVQRDLGDPAAGQGHLEKALRLLESMPAATNRDVEKGLVSLNLAFILRQQGKNEEAEPLLRQAIEDLASTTDPSHFLLAQGYNNLALLLYQKGDFDGTEQALKKSLAMAEIALGPNHPQTLGAAGSLAGLYTAQGRLEDSEVVLADLVERWRNSSDNDAMGAHLLGNYSNVLKHLGRRQEAEAPLLEGIALRRKVFGPDHFDTARMVADHGFLLMDLGRPAEGEAILRRARGTSIEALGDDHPAVDLQTRKLAEIVESRGRCSETVELLRPLLDRRAEPQAEFIHRRLALARCLLPDEPTEALRLMDEVMEQKELLQGAPSLPAEYVDGLHAAARALVDPSTAEPARTTLDQALADLESRAPRTRPFLIDDLRLRRDQVADR